MSRQKQSPLEDLISIASMMPWWGGLLFAIVSYIFFHQLTQIEVPTATGLDKIGGLIWKQGIQIFSTFLQYILPIAFILGATISAAKQWKRKSIFENQSNLETVRNLSWQSFEYLISEAYRRKGYTVEETADGPDGGIDLILKKENRVFLVQCKHWRARSVTVKEVRELKGVVSGKGAYAGILVTSGQFTSDAVEEAEAFNIELVDGSKLATLIPQLENANLETESVPACPKCGSALVMRTARQGANAGKDFWGCSTFPRCRGILNIGS